ncbi:MAG: bicyclomycin resistance protein [Leptothrix sp. (in: Bacteria)]|nr:bicyclomycin resistance protein [Leptothrix sp. (in: b-proteobacteria)]
MTTTFRSLTLAAGLALALATAALTLPAAQAQTPAASAATAGAKKVIRYAFRVAETSFDPAQITDLYSRTVAAGIYDAPYEWSFLAKPMQMRPATAAGMPEISDDFKTFTIRIKPGIYFADDPAFKGVKRELTAEDYVYSLKRHYDPRWKSGNLYILENAKILGLSELRKKLIAEKKPFDYDTPVEGLRALDRYTFQIKLAEAEPRFISSNFTDGSFTGALAREVVEFYGDKIGEHPVGTGPYRLAQWKRSSRIVLAKNPNFREAFYDETAPEGNARLQAIAQKMKGQRLPMVEEVHISIIEENQPRWLAFLNEEHDLLEELPADFATGVIPNNQLAPIYAKRGMQMVRYPRADVAVSYFGMENPVVGGYEPHQVALRRAISLAVDVDREIRLVRRGQAIPAQGPIAPETSAYNPKVKTVMSDYSLAQAKALLDLHGWVDKDGDGWRDQPDGSPLLIEYATQPDQQSRQLIELWQKNMKTIGIRIEFKTAKWPENLKSSRAGKLMMWGVGWTGGPDSDTFLALGYGPNKGQANHARFNLPAFNRLYEQQRGMPDGPERYAVMAEAARLMVAYMPYKVHVHRIFTDLAQPWVMGYHRNNFVRDFWKYVDIDAEALQRRRGAGL